MFNVIKYWLLLKIILTNKLIINDYYKTYWLL